MKLSGSYTFSAPREEVWRLLHDPAILRRIIPGCERLEETGEDTYAADIKLGLAGVKGDYSGTVRISDKQEPERYRLQGEGRGKPGFAKGDGVVELIAEPDGTTTMRYSADAQVGGPVAGIGQRLIEGAAKSIVNQSLKALSAELEGRRPGDAEATETELDTQPALGTIAEVNSVEAQSVPPAPPAPPRIEAAGLSTTDIIRGMADDLLAEQPILRWALPLLLGLLVGTLLGIRIGRSDR